MKKNRLIVPIFVFFLLVSSVSAAAPSKETTIDGDYPWIRIDSIGDHYVGDQFTISGTTNIPVDESFIFETVSSSKWQNGDYSGQSQIVTVVKGDTNNKWSVDVDASTFKPDEYVVNVESVGTDSTALTTFNLLEKRATTTTVKTAATTAIKTTTATITVPPPTSSATAKTTTIPQAPPATTAAPGFGAIVSLIALGTAATIFLRKE
ncbi:PGF-CTERM sorting domain-containing protein [Methanolacinia paynteri]|uniref:PGF-CTERM sorting domain-containing protein n=1 Tax=Methanolacinia paynteri TaxID=230356 RepID=UPI0006932951|nr:PGF-CTERM sorting domain-containing protein [Methanolacinia paynteri]